MYEWAFSLVASLLSSVKWIFLLSVLLQVHSLFQSKLSTKYDLMNPLSISSMLSFIYVHPVAAYICFLILLPLFFLYCIFPSKMCIRMQFLRQMWPVLLAFLLLSVWYSSPPWLFVTLHFSHVWSNWSPSFSSTIFQNFPGISVLLPQVFEFQHQTNILLLTKCKHLCKCRETHFKLHNITLQVGQFCIVALHTFCALFVSMFLTKLKSGCSVSTKNNGVQKDSIIIVSVHILFKCSEFDYFPLHTILCCVSIAKLVMWTRHTVIVYVHCISCLEFRKV